MEKYVYSFKEGNKDLRSLLGGKGANLAEMTNLGLPIPQGFIVTTEACNQFYLDNNNINDNIISEIENKLTELETITGKKFDNPENPLLLSVRSGSKVSMPGMMDTILNLGLTLNVINNHSNKRFIFDCYRRLIMMYAEVVMGNDKNKFEDIITNIKKEKKLINDLELDANDLRTIVIEFRNLYKKLNGVDFPDDPKVQLIEAIKAVFKSWNNKRAITYRKINNISDSLGTAVNIQEMVYGNLNELSATGVAFSRNPSTGEDNLFGEYLMNAQGEDIVAGIRTPEPIDNLKEKMKEIYDEFLKYSKQLEAHYKDMQDMEFTIENNKLYLLQTRNGKRTAFAALKIALDMLRENIVTKEEAILMVEPDSLSQLLHPTLDMEEVKNAKVIAKGINASPGGASGKIAFDIDEILNSKGDFILVRKETSAEDIKGMYKASGVLTNKGGMTSHAAVVARSMGRCCVSGCEELIINEDNKTITTKSGKVYKNGDYISINGNTGEVYDGLIKLVEPTLNDEFKTFMDLLDEFDHLELRANADNESDAVNALKFGAKGIGLIRTEHMFFNEDRITIMQQMILADNLEERKIALDQLEKMQASDFEAIFKVMNGYPVTVRYLDPPLHEFLPKTDSEIKTLSKKIKKSPELIKNRINELKEFNPMMGHRGCRLAITYPDIALMQTKAIIDAISNLDKLDIKVKLEIMLPLIGSINEFTYLKEIIENEIKTSIGNLQIEINYEIGSMIEVPRACIIADKLAKASKFFSFGTNDLTQMVYGFSRDDSNKFLDTYYEKNILEKNPFVTIDNEGVLKLMITAIKLAKMTNPDIKLGVCGEHGGDALSAQEFTKIGLDYVSCSPYRLPIAKLASVQAAIKARKN